MKRRSLHNTKDIDKEGNVEQQLGAGLISDQVQYCFDIRKEQLLLERHRNFRTVPGNS